MKQLHRLRILRAERNWTQLEVGHRLGWSPTLLWRIEHGYRKANPAERLALAALFDVNEETIWPASGEEAA